VDDLETTTDDSTAGDDGAGAAAPPPAAAADLSPDAVRNTPEYRVLAKQNRELARQAGAAKREAEQARIAAEQARQAAEAQRQADLEAELVGILGDDATVATFNEISELGRTDPAAAARRIAELVAAGRAQSVTEGDQPAAPPAPAPQGGTTVDTPPAPPRGVGADAALSQRTRTLNDEETALADELEARFTKTAERVQNPETRNRTTWRERTDALIGFVAGGILRERVRQRTNNNS
jgi:hypothetical protein